jgi:uncharacterized protein (TIRG00374 family)
MRRILLWLALVGFLVVLVTRFAELERIVSVVRSAHIAYILLGALLQLAFVANQAAFYASVSRALGRPLSVRVLLLPAAAYNFAVIAVPSGNVSGAMLMSAAAVRAGLDSVEAALMNVIYYIFDYGAFLLMLGVGLVYLHVFHDLQTAELVASAILLAGVLLALALLAAAVVWPERACALLDRLCSPIVRRLRRFRRLEGIPENWAAAVAQSLRAAALALRRYPTRMVVPAVHALLVEGITVLTLYIVFLAFGQTVSFGVLMAGYAMGMLFMIVSVTPQGIGFVEGAMVLVFSSLGVEREVAAVVALVYRGLTLWLPFVLGFVAFRRVMVADGTDAAAS